MIFAKKNILVIGAGISGRSVAKVLKSIDANVTLNDAKAIDENTAELKSLKAAGVCFVFGSQSEALLDDMEYVVISPGISIYSPLVQAAYQRKISVMSEVEVAYRLSLAPIVAITGTNGKTTTTTLIGEMLKATGKETVVGGNIGLALSQEVQGVSAEGVVIAEISSFQLEGIIDFRPHIAAVLNLTPDHLDRHRSMTGYQEAKERVFVNQGTSDFLVLNYDDEVVRKMADRARSRIFYFSSTKELDAGAYIGEDNAIIIRWNGEKHYVCPVSDMKLFGRHNVENALAACGVAFLAGVEAKTMADVLRTFAGVEHRIELVRSINGVTYYNDSKATNPESSIKALEAFSGHLVLIAGGRDKNTDLTTFMTLARERVDHLILLGEASERFGTAAQKHQVKNIHFVNSMADAVKLAYQIARPPQAVLLSPACASYDMFNNYEERGSVFKDLVCRLV